MNISLAWIQIIFAAYKYIKKHSSLYNLYFCLRCNAIMSILSIYLHIPQILIQQLHLSTYIYLFYINFWRFNLLLLSLTHTNTHVFNYNLLILFASTNRIHSNCLSKTLTFPCTLFQFPSWSWMFEEQKTKQSLIWISSIFPTQLECIACGSKSQPKINIPFSNDNILDFLQTLNYLYWKILLVKCARMGFVAIRVRTTGCLQAWYTAGAIYLLSMPFVLRSNYVLRSNFDQS